jgi:hypothetical protein
MHMTPRAAALACHEVIRYPKPIAELLKRQGAVLGTQPGSPQQSAAR